MSFNWSEVVLAVAVGVRGTATPGHQSMHAMMTGAKFEPANGNYHSAAPIHVSNLLQYSAVASRPRLPR